MKHLRYLSYVLRHRWFVFVECVKLGIAWRGLVHDLSKFLPSEWFPYVAFFEGPNGVKAEGKVAADVRAAFDVAWLQHIHRSRHHWQYWRLREDDGGTKLLPMPDRYVKEMLADWRGAAQAQGYSGIGGWYKKNKGKIELHPHSHDLLHSLMDSSELE